MNSKVFINNRFFRVTGINNISLIYNNELELKKIINDFLNSYIFNEINLFKSVNKRAIKIGKYKNLDGLNSLDVICDKNIVNIFKDEMDYLGYSLLKPNGGKNKQKVLK